MQGLQMEGSRPHYCFVSGTLCLVGVLVPGVQTLACLGKSGSPPLTPPHALVLRRIGYESTTSTTTTTTSPYAPTHSAPVLVYSYRELMSYFPSASDGVLRTLCCSPKDVRHTLQLISRVPPAFVPLIARWGHASAPLVQIPVFRPP